MTLAELQPDVALAALLDGKVQAKSASGKMAVLRVFADGERGNKDADDEFIEILYNGNPNDVTTDRTLWQGNLAVYLRCKMQADTKVKKSRIRLILSQIEPLVHCKQSDGYFFQLANQPITPPQRDYSTGYAYAIYNVAWRYNSLSKIKQLNT